MENVDAVKAVHQLPAHPAKGGVIQIAVVGDEAQHALAFAVAVNHMFGKADEFHIVIIDPLGIALLQLLLAARLFLVGFHKPRSEEHTSALTSLMRLSYAVFFL